MVTENLGLITIMVFIGAEHMVKLESYTNSISIQQLFKNFLELLYSFVRYLLYWIDANWILATEAGYFEDWIP